MRQGGMGRGGVGQGRMGQCGAWCGGAGWGRAGKLAWGRFRWGRVERGRGRGVYSEAEALRLFLQDYVHRECGMVVHKRFGRSKRVSEEDKKDMTAMMALR